jgi:hypothetical protein
VDNEDEVTRGDWEDLLYFLVVEEGLVGDLFKIRPLVESVIIGLLVLGVTDDHKDLIGREVNDALSFDSVQPLSSGADPYHQTVLLVIN